MTREMTENQLSNPIFQIYPNQGCHSEGGRAPPPDGRHRGQVRGAEGAQVAAGGGDGAGLLQGRLAAGAAGPGHEAQDGHDHQARPGGQGQGGGHRQGQEEAGEPGQTQRGSLRRARARGVPPGAARVPPRRPGEGLRVLRLPGGDAAPGQDLPVPQRPRHVRRLRRAPGGGHPVPELPGAAQGGGAGGGGPAGVVRAGQELPHGEAGGVLLRAPLAGRRLCLRVCFRLAGDFEAAVEDGGGRGRVGGVVGGGDNGEEDEG